MSWIQENKFIAGLAGVTAVLGGAILYFGNSQGGAYEEKMLEFEDLKTQRTKLVKAKPYPDAANLKARQTGINRYENVITDVRKSLVGYQPGKLSSLTPEQFSDAQVKMQAGLNQAFEAAGTTLPEKCAYGFEKYATIQAKSSATARLNFELGALQWLLGKLAETKPQALINVRRELLDVETGKAAAPAARNQRNKRAQRNNNAAAEKPFVLMPIELAFTTTEDGLRRFLKQMANSEKYYYAIRAIRIRNEKQTAPTVKDADFPAPRASLAPANPEDPFGGLVLPDSESEDGADTPDASTPIPMPAPVPPKTTAPGERILKRVLGDEKLNVYISFDILLIKGDGAAKPAS